MFGGTTRRTDLTEEELKIRKKEAELFAKISEPPTANNPVMLLLGKDDNDEGEDDEESSTVNPKKRPRGRPRKSNPVGEAIESFGPKKKRTRQTKPKPDETHAQKKKDDKPRKNIPTEAVDNTNTPNTGGEMKEENAVDTNETVVSSKAEDATNTAVRVKNDASLETKNTETSAESTKDLSPPRKRGRPRKPTPEAEEQRSRDPTTIEAKVKRKETTNSTIAANPPTRKRGRPRKDQNEAKGDKVSSKKLDSPRSKSKQPKRNNNSVRSSGVTEDSKEEGIANSPNAPRKECDAFNKNGTGVESEGEAPTVSSSSPKRKRGRPQSDTAGTENTTELMVASSPGKGTQTKKKVGTNEKEEEESGNASTSGTQTLEAVFEAIASGSSELGRGRRRKQST